MAETEEQTRRGWLKAMPYLLLAAYIVVPLVLIPAAGSSASSAMIAFLFGTAGLVSLIDATLFRPTYSIPLLCGVGFWLAKMLYLNEGTFVYGHWLRCHRWTVQLARRRNRWRDRWPHKRWRQQVARKGHLWKPGASTIPNTA